MGSNIPFDPKKMHLMGKGAGRVQPQQAQELVHRKRISDLMALRNMSRMLERQPVYFIPAEFNPLAVLGFIQNQDPREGIAEMRVPWSIPVAFIDDILPKVEVMNRKFTFYEIHYGNGAITLQMHDVIEEPPKAAEEKPQSEEPASAAQVEEEPTADAPKEPEEAPQGDPETAQ